MKATQIFDVDSSDVKFVLQVVCIPYPCHIISAWIFVAVIPATL